jgi:hypothetical protein
MTMKYIISFITVLLLGCGHQPEKETMYFFFRGDRIYSFPDLVLKNNTHSFVGSIMPIGKPMEYLITVDAFANLKHEVTRHSQFNEDKGKYDTGIMIVLYDSRNKMGSYLFRGNYEINELLSVFEKNLSGETKLQGIGWIDGECKIHKIR